MRLRHRILVAVVAWTIGASLLVSAVVTGQSGSTEAGHLRMPWGDPDLRVVRDNQEVDREAVVHRRL